MTKKTLEECRLIANAFENILAGKNPYYRDKVGNDPEFRNHVRTALAEERSLIGRVAAFGV